MNAMKAAVVTDFGKPLEIQEPPIPEPGPGQVLVHFQASGLCHTDIHAAHGDWPVKPKPPFIPGHEGVGPIERIGAGVPDSMLGKGVRSIVARFVLRALPLLRHRLGDPVRAPGEHRLLGGRVLRRVRGRRGRRGRRGATGREFLRRRAVDLRGLAASPQVFDQAYRSLRRGGRLICVALPGGEASIKVPIFQTVLNGRVWAARGVCAVSLDLLPRTLSRAQSMDALTSQASVAGYKAALLAPDSFDRCFPMLTTAAGTSKPAAVLVLGTGVAGLQAIAAARRLGAVVSGYDVRPQSKGEVESLGAKFLDLTAAVESGAGEGGYARELTGEEQRAQQEALDAYIAASDIVITTAQVPGRKPPLLVTATALDRMRAGSVVVDMAAGDLGGNVALSEPDKTVGLPNGVRLIGAGALPSAMATEAHQGEVVNPALAAIAVSTVEGVS